MEATVSYLLMLQKYISSKQKIQNKILCTVLVNVSKDSIINNMKKAGLKEVAKFFSVDFNPIDTNNILDIHPYKILSKTKTFIAIS